MTGSNPLADEQDIQIQISEFLAAYKAIKDRLAEIIVGQQEVIDGVLSAVFLQGHVLLEGVPGLGKTLLVSALGNILGLKSNRVQFTPDLMPADIVGTRVIKQEGSGSIHFEFERGPVFTQILLADEINRATPKTQSALLEAMQERRVTVSGTTYPLPEPFIVLATQNPLESEGTYPLPDAQLDRFLFKLLVRFPTQLELIEIIKRTTGTSHHQAQPIVDSSARLLQWARLIRRIPVATPVLDYAARVLLATHPASAGKSSSNQYLRGGASPRGMQAMILAGKLKAVLEGRFTVSRQDISAVALQCLRHRILLTFEAEAQGVTPDQVIQSILEQVN